MFEADFHLQQELDWNNNPNQFQERWREPSVPSHLLCHAVCLWTEYLDNMSGFLCSLNATVHLFHTA